MSSWDDLYELIQQAERALHRLKADENALQWEVLKHVEAGWYTRGYLAERLPAEIARSRRSGRPFGLGMLRVATPEEMAPGNWRSFLFQYLDPVEVAVAYSDRDLCFLLPELDGPQAKSRIYELAGTAVVSGLVNGASLWISALSYPEVQAVPAALLLRLEEGLVPYAAAIGGRLGQGASTDSASATCEAIPASSSRSGAPGGERLKRDLANPELAGGARETAPANAEPGARGEDDGRARKPQAAARVPAGVGFAADRRLPVSIWYRGELYTIRAILDDEERQHGGRRMVVVTEDGLFRLEREGEHWYAAKVES
ncbi:MAG TPA: hypothetical protein VK101_07240 [Limnochordia bacterium]|nr:hypothetical protein [Limnochordia bacterium]